jgi:hypothetical protein
LNHLFNVFLMKEWNMLQRLSHALGILIVGLALSGCSDDTGTGGTTPDTGIDSGFDAGADTGADTSSDVGGDTGSDTGSDTGTDTGPDTSVDETCTPNPDLVAEKRRCQVDDHCPCGSFCNLGECTANCTTADDCGSGQTCDRFGRCRNVGDTALVPVPPAQAQGRVQVDQPQVVLESGTEVTLPVHITERAVDRMRVVASFGAQVRCPDAADFALSCELTNTAAGETVEVIVRRALESSGDDLASVTIYGPSNTTTVSLPSLDQLLNDTGGVDAPPVAIAGRYTGTMRLIGAGMNGDLENLPDAPAPTAMVIKATVWDGAGQTIIAIDDPFGALTSASRLIGTVDLDDADAADGVVDGSATFVNHPFVEATVAGQLHRLVAETVEARVRSRLNPRSLSLVLVQSYKGHGTDESPTVRWSIELQRRADATENAPALPAPATLGFDPVARLAAPSPWEAATALFTQSALMGPFASESYGFPLAASCRNNNESARLSAQRDALGWWLLPPFITAGATNRFAMPLHKDLLTQLGYTEAFGYLDSTLPAYVDTEGAPCAFTNLSLTLATPNGNRTINRATFDYCAEIERTLGCTVSSYSAPLSMTNTTWFDGFADGESRLTATTTKVCKFPNVLPSCGEQLACLDDDAPVGAGTGFSAKTYQGGLFSQTTVAHVGDLQCAQGRLAAGIALDRQAEGLTASAVIARCLPELARLQVPAPTTTRNDSPNSIFAVSAECVDIGRMLAAISAQGRAFGPGTVPLNEVSAARASAYTQRMLVRWLELHGFLAAEAAQVERVAEIFRGAQSSPSVPATIDMVNASTRGWDIFLTPHVFHSALTMPEGSLVEPDYRFHRFGMTGRPVDEQQGALGSVIVETLSRQVRFLQIYIEKNGTPNDPGAPNPLASFMPRMLVAQALAADLNSRARLADPQLPWADSYDAAVARAESAMSSTFSYIDRLNSGANPLGIEDADLPLYFLADDATGAGGRFSAVSDYILGSNPGSNAWAPSMVAKAQAGLTATRTAFLEQSDRDVRQARSQLAQDRFIEDVRYDYNVQLRDFCGPLNDSLIDDPDFNAENCMLNRADPNCSTDQAAWYGRWTEEDMLGKLCMQSAIESNTLDRSFGFHSGAMRAFAEACYANESRPRSGVVSVGPCAANAANVCLRCDWQQDVAEVNLSRESFELNVPGAGNNAAGPWLDIVSQCQRTHSGMRLNVPRPQNPLEVPGCVRGSLGEALLDIVDAAADVESAQQSIVERNEAYGIAMESCFILQEANQAISDAMEAHKVNMRGLRIARSVAEGVAIAAGAVSNCAATVAGAGKTTPWEAIAGGAAAGVACGAGAVEAAANITAMALDAVMEGAQLAHDNLVANLEQTAELNICFNDAKQELVGLKAATMDLEGAVFALERANARANEQIATAQRLHQEGYEYIAELEAQELPSAAGDVWGDERVNAYLRDFQLARRATYLAVRAVEYEFQQSLGARQDVLKARVPADLETVLQTLWAASGTRNINGSRPSELTTVLSLRDDILRLGDESAWPDEMRPLSRAQRFRLVLSAERYATYDRNGRYLGQRIPFTLAPLEAFNFDGGSVPIYADTDCAERLWSVNAGIVGTNVFRGSDTTNARIDLLKRNSFFSQWCTSPSSGQPDFQTASVRPGRNLFRQPGVGEPVGTNQTRTGVDSFTRARIQAFFGMTRARMEDPQYANGETSELAARGLYGEYALFIPANLISRNGSNGLVLDAFDDILLRIDYLSVAKN